MLENSFTNALIQECIACMYMVKCESDPTNFLVDFRCNAMIIKLITNNILECVHGFLLLLSCFGVLVKFILLIISQ